MGDYSKILQWIDGESNAMRDLAVAWSRINSHTFNLDGLKEQTEAMIKAFSIFGEPIEKVDLPSFERVNILGIKEQFSAAPLITLQKRPQAKKQVLLVCHMDTVFPKESPFQETKVIDEEKIVGPGITDAKGGIVIMLKALQAIERHPSTSKIGWRVIINTDEEIGSLASSDYIVSQVKHYGLGLVFEPSFPGGELVSARKGSGNFTLVVHGKSAHAGRDHHYGRNAILALSHFIAKVSALTDKKEGLTVNVGIIRGGTAVNVVPDLAIGQYNVRYLNPKDKNFVATHVAKCIKEISKAWGVKCELHGTFSAPPKLLNNHILSLLKHLKACGKEIGLKLRWRESGGVTDGNRMAAAGLTVVDTLGAQGGFIHSADEFIFVNSLTERAKLTALCLLKWADNEWDLRKIR